jgi:hypothetical protein
MGRPVGFHDAIASLSAANANASSDRTSVNGKNNITKIPGVTTRRGG